MNSINESIVRYSKRQPFERVLMVIVAAIVLYFIADIGLLKPQQKKLAELRNAAATHSVELMELQQHASKTNDQMTSQRATLDQIKKQIAEFDSILGESDGAPSDIGSLLREMLDVSPGLTLVSLKTLPVTQFYAPAPKTNANDKNASATNVNEVQKIIYKHGVEISVKGNYLALLSYMEHLQKYPKRLFWSEAKLDVVVYPDAVLKLVVYSLSDQSSSPLH